MKLTEEQRADVLAVAKIAHEEGMAWEFWSAYLSHRRAGNEPWRAAWDAAYDWDIC